MFWMTRPDCDRTTLSDTDTCGVETATPGSVPASWVTVTSLMMTLAPLTTTTTSAASQLQPVEGSEDVVKQVRDILNADREPNDVDRHLKLSTLDRSVCHL